jgi:hypothetical protein
MKWLICKNLRTNQIRGGGGNQLKSTFEKQTKCTIYASYLKWMAYEWSSINLFSHISWSMKGAS